jgi:hypothetical protein
LGGQILIHNVIDNDHWRHLFLLYGILWGIIAADRRYVRDVRRGDGRIALSPTGNGAALPAFALRAAAGDRRGRSPEPRPA